MVELDAGSDADLPAIRELLDESSLPLDGLMAVPTRWVVARDRGRLVGAGALEAHGNHSLLRSLVVAPDVRTLGVGSGIVGELERIAADRGSGGIYLLTDTAEGFFKRRGYVRIDRDAAPDAVRRSEEWAVTCSASATPMVRADQVI